MTLGQPCLLSLGHGILIPSSGGLDAVRNSTTQSRQTNIRCQSPERRSTAAGANNRPHRTVTQTARDCIPALGTPTPAAPVPAGLLEPLRSAAPPSPRPWPIHATSPSSACGAFRWGHSPGRPATYKGAAGASRPGYRGDARSGGEPASQQAAPETPARSWEKREERRGSRAVSSSPLPPGRDRARRAALGRGQRFFV